MHSILVVFTIANLLVAGVWCLFVVLALLPSASPQERRRDARLLAACILTAPLVWTWPIAACLISW